MGFLEEKLKQYGYDVDVRTGELKPMRKSKASRPKTEKSKVKKWEQSYGVGIAYFGVLTLNQDEFYNHEDDVMGGYSFAQNAKFRGTMQKVIEGIPINLVGYIDARIQNIKVADEYDIMFGEYENGDREVPRDMAEEIADASNYRATKATYTYTLWYSDPSNEQYGRSYVIYDSDEDGDSRSAKYSSIEDCIRAMEQESEKAYGKVMEYVNGEMAKSCNDRAKKSEVEKEDDSRAYEEATSLYAYMNTVQDAIAQLDLYVRRLHNKIVDGEPTAQASSDVIDWVDTSISALEGIKLKAQIISKAKKSSVKKDYPTAEERAEGEIEEAWRWTVGTNVPSQGPDGTWFIQCGMGGPKKFINIIELAKQDPSFWEESKRSLTEFYKDAYPDLYKGKAKKSKF